MKKKVLVFKSFALILAIIWILSDICLTIFDPFKFFPYFYKNDFEVTELNHPEKVWDKVFYGSSVVAASYLEEHAKSGYYNAGVSYGTVSDVYNLLKKGEMKVGSELVIGLNDISFLDELDTNPTYIWHKKWYQHYLYFQRDKIYPLIETGITNVLNKLPFLAEPAWEKQTKNYCYGQLTDEQLFESEKSMLERFGTKSLEDCEKNFNDLEKLIKFCKKKNIRLRVIWMPWNPKIPLYEFAKITMNHANDIFAQNGIEVYDMTNMVEPQYFYDIGHMSYQEGSPYFTKMVDEFLSK